MLKKILKAAMLTVCAVTIPIALSTDTYAEPISLSKKVKVGDMVYFGTYEQDGNKKNGKEKIEWRVLDRQGDKALLITDKLLDTGIPYNKEYKDITWEDSTVRRWVNRIFLNEAFGDKEKKRIEETEVENKDNEEYGTDGGRDTTDRVFLLSTDEANKYFQSDDDRKAKVTEYYKQKYREIMINRWGNSEEEADDSIRYMEEERDNCNFYWLRSPGNNEDSAAYVDYDGSVGEYGNDVLDADGGVRSALWVKL